MQPLNSKDWISKDFSKFGVQKINSTVVFGGSGPRKTIDPWCEY